jgi:hypothetical protein
LVVAVQEKSIRYASIPAIHEIWRAMHRRSRLLDLRQSQLEEEYLPASAPIAREHDGIRRVESEAESMLALLRPLMVAETVSRHLIE